MKNELIPIRERTSISGFTLIEVLLVLLLMSLVSTLTVINYRAPLQRAKMELLSQRIAQLENAVRRWTKQNNCSAQVQFDLERQVSIAENNNGVQLPFKSIHLKDGLIIDHLTLQGRELFGKHRVISYTAWGHSQTWSYTITAPDGQNISLMVIGLTGQTFEL